MNINVGMLLFLIIIGVFILIVINFFTNNRNNCSNYQMEHMINVDQTDNNAWHRNKCNYYMNKTYRDILDNNSIPENKEAWNIYLPCTYDNIDEEISQMPEKKDAKYFIINNADNMTAKNWLWKNVVDFFGVEKARTMLPNTYVLDNPADIKRLEDDYKKGNIYIMKKNIQRQEGLKITDNLDDIINGAKNNYVIAQDLLQNPYTIGGRKTNMRFYVLVVCNKGDIDVYVHNEGFMYYTKDQFKKGSLDDGPNITTGYIERAVYKVNPLTHGDLREYLDKSDRPLTYTEHVLRERGLKLSSVYFSKIYKLLGDIFTAFIGKICGGNKLNNNVTFQLFGVDVGMNDDYNPMVMEINKGPDMGAKDERDSALKHKVVQDMMSVIGAVEGKHNFIKVLDYENGNIKFA